MVAASALGGFIGGLQQGYSFVDDMRSRRADQARRLKDDERREKDALYLEESRGRQRNDWKKEDQYKTAVESLNTEFFPPPPKATPAPALGIKEASAPATAALPPEAVAVSVPAPVVEPSPEPTQAATSAVEAVQKASPVAVAPVGMPQAAPATQAEGVAPVASGMRTTPGKPTGMAASMDYFIRRAELDMQHGKIDGPGMAALYQLRNSTAKEGLNEAIQLLAKGDNAGAMRQFNENGDMKGWSVVSSEDGVFDHGGAKLPTKIVTVRADDGSTRIVNTAQQLVQNQRITDLIAQAQKGVEMGDRRDDAKGARRIQQQQADTQEQYRLDQAENMREQRRLQAAGLDAKTSTTAPIWTKEDDTFLKDQYSSKDELTGNKTFDGEGLQFAKQVAVARSRFNGGDSATASAYALSADANLKAQSKGDPVMLRKLRTEALQKLAAAAPRPAAGGDADWERRTATSRAGAPAREDGRRAILEQELAKETDPSNIAALKRELAALGPVRKKAGAPDSNVENPFEDTDAAAPPAAPTRRRASFTVGGMSIEERDKRIDLFNKKVGGGADRQRFTTAMDDRKKDVADNFDTKLAAIRRNMPRAEAYAVLSWFDSQGQAGTLSKQQLMQVRKARQAAGL